MGVSIRGRVLTGVITKMKMNRTVVIRRDYLHYVKKYNRFEKRHKNMSVHLLQGRPGRRQRHRRRVQTSQQDRQVQHPEGDQGTGQQEVVRQVLTDVPTTMLKR